NASAQSGSAWHMITRVTSVRPDVRGINHHAAALPITAPTPNAANNQPATRASPPYRAITSTGIAAKIACHAASPTEKLAVQARRGAVRGAEDAERKRENDQHAERQGAGPMQRGNGEHQWGAQGVCREHCPFRAEPPEHRSARDPEERVAGDLGSEDEAHPRR